MGEEDPYQFIRCRRDSPRLQKLEKGSVSHGWTPPLSLHTHTQYTQRSARHSHIQKSLVKQTDRLRWELVWRSTIVNHGYHYSNYSYSNLFEFRDFSVGAEVQSSPSSAGDTGSTPGWGTKIPQAMVHLSLSAATREARMLQKRPDAAKKKKNTFFFKKWFLFTGPRADFNNCFLQRDHKKIKYSVKFTVPQGLLHMSSGLRTELHLPHCTPSLHATSLAPPGFPMILTLAYSEAKP